jgi:hypothetical protein
MEGKKLKKLSFEIDPGTHYQKKPNSIETLMILSSLEVQLMGPVRNHHPHIENILKKIYVFPQ